MVDHAANEIAAKSVRQQELKNLIELAKLPAFDSYSDDITKRIIAMTNLKKNDPKKQWGKA